MPTQHKYTKLFVLSLLVLISCDDGIRRICVCLFLRLCLCWVKIRKKREKRKIRNIHECLKLFATRGLYKFTRPTLSSRDSALRRCASSARETFVYRMDKMVAHCNLWNNFCGTENCFNRVSLSHKRNKNLFFTCLNIFRNSWDGIEKSVRKLDKIKEFNAKGKLNSVTVYLSLFNCILSS